MKNAGHLFDIYMIGKEKQHSEASNESVYDDPSVNMACVQYNRLDLERKDGLFTGLSLQMVHGQHTDVFACCSDYDFFGSMFS